MTAASSHFASALHADGPAADLAGKMQLYAFLIGDWEFDAVIHLEDGGRHAGLGRIHFGWVLEGRAIQDVWILPEVFHGTTLRVYDPALDAWHIVWSDPIRQLYAQQLGRAQGPDIVQEGKSQAGVPLRWRFTEIRPDSFLWLGETSSNGEDWSLQAEFHARRLPMPARSPSGD